MICPVISWRGVNEAYLENGAFIHLNSKWKNFNSFTYLNFKSYAQSWTLKV